MFGGKSQSIRPERVDTVIGKETKCTGTMEVRGALRVEGQVEGEIRGRGDIIVGEAAQVKANIEGRNVIVAGRVIGNVHCEGRLELLPSAHLAGDITVGDLLIASGAHFSGKSSMVKAAPAKPQAQGSSKQVEPIPPGAAKKSSSGKHSDPAKGD